MLKVRIDVKAMPSMVLFNVGEPMEKRNLLGELESSFVIPHTNVMYEEGIDFVHEPFIN